MGWVNTLTVTHHDETGAVVRSRFRFGRKHAEQWREP